MNLNRYLLTLLVVLMGCSDSNDEPETETEESAPADVETVVDLQPGVNELTMDQEVEGELVQRSYIVHLPDDYDGSGSTPLLFAFHGNGGNGAEFVNQFTPPVQSGDFVGVYADGIANSWNIGREDSKADDVAFTAMMLAALEGAPGIDTSKPVGVGFSNGAALLHKIAIESELLVGIVPQVSQLLVENQPRSDGAKVSVMQFMGTVDDTCPYDGGEGVLGYDFMPAEDSAATWAAHNGCDSSPTETQVGEHVKMEWENCEANRRVVHYRLNGVGHGVPPNVDGGSNPRLIEFLKEARE